MDKHQLDRQVTFSDYGLDSILSLRFVEGINHALGITLNASELFNHSTIGQLTQFVRERFAGELTAVHQSFQAHGKERQPNNGESSELRWPVGEEEPSKKNFEVKKPALDKGIAIIGISGQFPDAANVEQFWENLKVGKDAVHELPVDRLDLAKDYCSEKQDGKSYCKWGGILEGRAYFDPLFFEISPKEATLMNPSQRLFLQESYQALEDAGYAGDTPPDQLCGVYVGCEPSGYYHASFTGASEAIVASRLPYFLNLQGPALVVNSGCSSSAVAIHLACEGLRHKEIHLAVAGGVFAMLDSKLLTYTSSIEMLSRKGRCHTFDDSADGTILAEAVGVVVLKGLDQALAAGDHFYGVIKASGINQDGRSNGITAPNGLAQEDLIKSVYQAYGINPNHISYMEAHGTGRNWVIL